MKINKLIDCFIFDSDEYGRDATASVVAKVLHLNRKTVNRYYTLFRQAIYRHQEGRLRHTGSEYTYFEEQRLNKFYGIKKNKQLHTIESQRRFGKERNELKFEFLKILDEFLK